jgi:hypothetical protein
MTNIWRDRYLRTRHMVQKTIREYNEKPTLKAYLEIFLTLITISMFGVFAIRPTIITIGKLLQEIKAKETTLTTMKQKIDNLKIAQEIYTREKEKIMLIDDAIPETPKPDLLALQIEILSKENNVGILNLGIEDTTLVGRLPEEDDHALSFTLNVYANYFDLVRFAKNIETIRRPIKYDALSINISSAKNNGNLYMSLKNLSTPYLPK